MLRPIFFARAVRVLAKTRTIVRILGTGIAAQFVKKKYQIVLFLVDKCAVIA